MAARKQAQTPPGATWKVKVVSEQIAYGDKTYEAGETFTAPLAAVAHAVNSGLLERVDE